MASAFICDSQQDSLGITWGCLGNGARQVWTLMEVALLCHQSMVVAPLLYPSGKTPEAIEVEARGPIEMFFYAHHVIDWAPFLDAQCFLLMREEVREERLL